MVSRGVMILAAILLLALNASAAGAQPHGFGERDAPRGGFGLGGRGAGFQPGRGGWAPGPYGGYPEGGYGGAYGRPAFGAPRAPNSLDQGWRQQQDEVRRAVREGRHVPLGFAIDAVRRRAPGRELDAGLEPGPDGRPVYRLRWAGQDGRRTDYMVDATTGRILGEVGGR